MRVGQDSQCDMDVWLNWTIIIKVARLSALAHGVTSMVAERGRERIIG